MSQIRGSRYTQTDFLYLLIKFALVYLTLGHLGFLIGSITILLTVWLFELILCHCFQLEKMNEVDRNSYYDHQKNRCIIIGTLVFEQFDDVEEIKQLYMHNLPSKWKRMRSKMLKIFGNYYFKELDQA